MLFGIEDGWWTLITLVATGVGIGAREVIYRLWPSPKEKQAAAKQQQTAAKQQQTADAHDRRDSWSEVWKIVDRQNAEIERLGAVTAGLIRREERCREDQSRLWDALYLHHAVLKNLAASGVKVDIPELPDLSSPDTSDAEYELRRSQFNTDLARRDIERKQGGGP